MTLCGAPAETAGVARILVIDDDAQVRALLDDVLSAAGHMVVLAADGHEGLAAHQRHCPDLVITDIFMPHRDGLQVILELASSRANVIAISGGGNVHHLDHLDDALHFGACACLAKPFTIDVLLKTVNDALARPV